MTKWIITKSFVYSSPGNQIQNLLRPAQIWMRQLVLGRPPWQFWIEGGIGPRDASTTPIGPQRTAHLAAVEKTCTHQTNPTIAQYCPVQSNTSTAQYSQVQPILEPDPNFLVKPDPNPTRSQKALLVKPCLRHISKNLGRTNINKSTWDFMFVWTLVVTFTLAFFPDCYLGICFFYHSFFYSSVFILRNYSLFCIKDISSTRSLPD